MTSEDPPPSPVLIVGKAPSWVIPGRKADLNQRARFYAFPPSYLVFALSRRKNKKKQGGKKARALLIKAPLVDRGAGTYDTKHSTEALIH
jgi:hypothetical protein